MRRWMLVFVICCLSGTVLAQDDALTPYDIALQRIQDAEASGATELYLARLDLTEIPSEISNLTNLTILNLSGNNLSTLPRQIFELTQLKEFYVLYNDLTEIPPEIGNLVNLEKLGVAINPLTSIPPEIGNLTDLKELNLSINSLTELPPEIGNLTNLELLYLDANDLTSLPPEIGRLTNLCFISLAGNELRYLPVEIGALNSLDVACSNHPAINNGVYLDNNPLISPPPEVVEQGTEAILEYLRNRAWWHLQRMIISIASGVGVLAMMFLGLLKYRQRGQRKLKQKRDIMEKA